MTAFEKSVRARTPLSRRSPRVLPACGRYVGVVLGERPETAALALDELLGGVADGVRGIKVLEIGETRLTLEWPPAAPPPRPTGCEYWPVRQYIGRMRKKSSPIPMAVEMELMPWSDSEAELGLRPRRWISPHVLPVPDTFRDLAAALLMHVASEIAQLSEGEIGL